MYIGVCDWGLTTLATEQPKSLYTFTSVADMDRTLAERWWLDPSSAYLHKIDADVEVIPRLSRETEEYAVAKIAQRMNRHCMSEAYSELQKETPSMSRLSHEVLALAFHQYFDRVIRKEGNLAHIVHRFSTTHRWPLPDDCFRHSY